MQIWYVHGAGASERSFNWLRAQLPEHTAKFISYDVSEPIASVIDRLSKAIDTSSILLGHSLGGIAAAACANHPCVEKLITLCAPFGGVQLAEFMSLFCTDPFFRDLRMYGPVLSSVRNARINRPHLAIVGTSGLPHITESNDGVLTVTSQMALDTTYQSLPLNHFEVLLSEEVVKLITSFLR